MDSRLSRRQTLKLCTASLLALGTANASGATESSAPIAVRDTESLARRIEALLKVSGVPGLSIALIDDARITWAQGFGYADRPKRKPVTAATIFQAASLTKPAFAYVALKLCEEGRMALDVPLKTYLPSFVSSLDPRADSITARIVLAHMSGLPFTHFPKWPETLEFGPGEKFGYSGAAYLYLQQVVENVLGQPLDAIMGARFLQPLGLASSAFVWRPEYEVIAAKGHQDDGSLVREKDRSRPEKANAAGSLHTTPTDFARFMINFILEQGAQAAGLDPVYKRMMLSPQVRLADGLGWGLGWGIRVAENGDRFWHWGDSRGYMNYAVGSLKDRSGLVVFTNAPRGLRLAEELAATILGEDERKTFSWIFEGFYKEDGADLRQWLPTRPEPIKRKRR